MKKGLTELVFILNKSGSMRGLEVDTIGSYNSMLTKQKAIVVSATLQLCCLITTMNCFMTVLTLRQSARLLTKRLTTLLIAKVRN